MSVGAGVDDPRPQEDHLAGPPPRVGAPLRAPRPRPAPLQEAEAGQYAHTWTHTDARGDSLSQTRHHHQPTQGRDAKIQTSNIKYELFYLLLLYY